MQIKLPVKNGARDNCPVGLVIVYLRIYFEMRQKLTPNSKLNVIPKSTDLFTVNAKVGTT